MSIERKPVLSLMGDASLFMRGVAAVVLIAFSSLIASPTVMAVENATESSTPAPQTDEAKLAGALQKTQRKLERMAEKLDDSEDVAVELAELQTLKAEITALSDSAMAAFDAIEAHIQDKNLPAVILERHNAAVADYQAQINRVLQNLTDIEAAGDLGQLELEVKDAKDHLGSKKHKRSHQPFDPDNLPNKSLKANPNNKPKEHKAQFAQAGLFSNPTIKVAALGDFTFGNLPGASDPAYLAATTEVTLSEAIKAKAEELNYDPVTIYHWVRNNIQWQPAWGAMQNADLTLSAQRGNAMDIASLLVALLRASGIPARYVHGTIDVPEAKFRNWADGFTNINAAADFAASGGIPLTTVVSGGKITKIRMEHIWVEAAIDYQPSKGAKNRDADSWVQMDPSFKQYEYLDGLDVVAISGIDPEQLAQDFVDSGTVNETEGWVSGFDPSILQNAQTQAQDALEQYIQDNLPDATVGDVIGGAKTIIQEYPVLPSSLPNRIVTTGARYGKLPTELQHQISYAFEKDILGDPIDSITFAWPEINNQKITLSFKPATPEDEAALQSLLPEGEITDISQLPDSIPAYLINVIPELKVNGQTVKQGSAMQLGEELSFTTVINYRNYGKVPYTYNVIAGSYLSVAAVGGNVSPQKLANLKVQVEDTKAKLESNDPNQIGDLTKGELLGNMFYAGTLGYYAQFNAFAQLMGRQQKASNYLASGYGTFGYEPDVEYFFGVPRALNPGGVAMDIPILRISGVDNQNANAKKNYNVQVGILSSALEHGIPEQLFHNNLNNPPEAISAVKALSKANVQGQHIYNLNSSNSADILPRLHHDADTMTEIRNALSTGKEIITHTEAVSITGWSGAGYIIIDPLTGDGAYKIGGGQNGSWLSLFIFAFVMILFFAAIITIVATVGLGILGTFLVSFEVFGFLAWVYDINNAKTFDDFNRASAGAALISILGLVPLAEAGSAGAVAAQWFGILLGTMLTNPFGWFY